MTEKGFLSLGIIYSRGFVSANRSNEQKGIIKNVGFYNRNQRGSTASTLWGRTQNEDLQMFEYRVNKEGQIVMIEKVKSP